MKTPKFSIIIPVTKTKYFRETLDSAGSQTFDDYEIIIINNLADGDIAWAKDFPKVQYFKNQKKLPPCENWNHGLRQASGEFVLFLSDDDMLLNECLSNAAAFLAKAPSANAIRIGRVDINIAGEIIGTSCPGKEYETIEEFIYLQYHYNRSQMLSDFIVRREKFDAIGGFNTEHDIAMGWAADHRALIECGSEGIYHINEPCVNYRMHTQNLSANPKTVKNALQADMNMINAAWAQVKSNDDMAKLARRVLEKKKTQARRGSYAAAACQLGLLEMIKIARKDSAKLGEKAAALAWAAAHYVYSKTRRTKK